MMKWDKTQRAEKKGKFANKPKVETYIYLYMNRNPQNDGSGGGGGNYICEKDLFMSQISVVKIMCVIRNKPIRHRSTYKFAVSVCVSVVLVFALAQIKQRCIRKFILYHIHTHAHTPTSYLC